MSKKRIALIVDHPLRDLPGVSLIAYGLANAGFDAFLVPMYAQERECLGLAPDFVLLNYLRKNNEVFAHRLMASGIQFGINDTEGGFYGDLSFYGGILSRDHSLYQHLNCNLVWGEKMAHYLRHDFQLPHPVIVTGLPRFDFYSPKYRTLDLNLLPHALKDKKIVLINTKVAVANPLFVSREKEIDLYRNKLGFSEEVIQHFLKYGELSIHDNLELARKVAEHFPEAEVIIRPHPHENDHTYREQIDKSRYVNIQVQREGPVIPWILGSKSILHRHCTTAIEAALAGKPALAPSWVHTSANAPDAEKVSHVAHTQDELDEYIRLSNEDRLQPTPSIEAEVKRIVDEWLYQVDGDSHRRVASAIAETLKPGLNPDRSIARTQFYRIFDHRTDAIGRAYDIFNRASRAFPPTLWQMEKMRLGKWTGTQKYFSPADIKKWIEPIRQLEKSPSLKIEWAHRSDEYFDRYPGLSVKVSLS